MDRAWISEALAEAEQRVALGLLHIQKQRRILAELKTIGTADDIGHATRLLATFEAVQARPVADRDRIAAELAQAES